MRRLCARLTACWPTTAQKSSLLLRLTRRRVQLWQCSSETDFCTEGSAECKATEHLLGYQQAAGCSELSVSYAAFCVFLGVNAWTRVPVNWRAELMPDKGCAHQTPLRRDIHLRLLALRRSQRLCVQMNTL